MTRRGSLIYYFAAVVVGSASLAVLFYLFALWLGRVDSKSHWARDIILINFYAIPLGMFPQLLIAFLLRRLATRMTWRSVWAWCAAGMGVTFLTVWALGMLGEVVERGPGSPMWRYPLLFLLVGPRLIAREGIWLTLPSGGLTAVVLNRIHCAFEPEHQGDVKLGVSPNSRATPDQ